MALVPLKPSQSPVLLCPLLQATPGPHSESILRMPPLPEDGVDGLHVGGLLLVDLAHVCAVNFIGPVDASDMKPSLR